MATNFYKYDNSYYKADTHEKILNLDDLKSLAGAGGKEITYAPDSGWVKIPDPQSISQYDVKGQFGTTLYGTKKAAPSNTLDSSTINTGLNSNAASNLPQTTADKVNEAFLNSTTANLETQKQNIYEIYQKQAEEAKAAAEKAKAEIEALRKQQEETLEATDPTKSPYYEQQQRITQDRLDAAEAASATLEENYMANQNSITELQTLLNTAQAKIEAERARPALESVSQGRTSRIITDYNGRIGVVQAVMSARNGQINMANTLINEAFDTVAAQRTDYINYANAVLNLMSAKIGDAEEVLIQATAEEKEAIKSQISMVENELKEAEEVRQIILDLMVEQPDLADKAGLSLTDTKEQIAQKIQTYYKAHPEAYQENLNITYQQVKDTSGNVIGAFNPSTGETTYYNDAGLKVGDYGGQCGEYINDILGTSVGDTWESKQAITNIKPQDFASNAQIGDVVVFKTKMPYGHIAAVTAVNGDQITITESNWNNDEKIGTRTISVNDPSITGVYRGAQFQQAAPVNNLKLDKNGVPVKISINGKDYFVTKDNDFVEPKIPAPDTTKEDKIAEKKAQSALDLKDHTGLDIATGFYLGRGQLTLSGEKLAQKEDFIASVQQLVSGLSLDALIEAKEKGATFGALSDTEMQILSSSATKIGTWVMKDKKGKVIGYKAGEQQMRDELDNIYKTLDSYIKNSSNLQSSMTNYTVGTVVQAGDGKLYKVINSNGDVEEVK